MLICDNFYDTFLIKKIKFKTQGADQKAGKEKIIFKKNGEIFNSREHNYVANKNKLMPFLSLQKIKKRVF